MTKQATSAIAAMNDELRKRLRMPLFGSPSTHFRICLTAGVSALPPPLQNELLLAIRDFADFSPASDPYNERDCGAVEIDGAGKIFWKIDYYGDETMTHGSEDPSDPARCFRVLTITSLGILTDRLRPNRILAHPQGSR